MIENFEWNDLVLTCKGWYETTGDIVSDMAVAIENNTNRCISFNDKTNADQVADVLINNVMPSFWEKLSVSEKTKPCFLYRTEDFYQKIRHHMFFYRYDLSHAIILAVHDIFCNYITRDMMKLNKPIYGKGRRRLGCSLSGRRPISMTYKHMNDIATKMFDR